MAAEHYPNAVSIYEVSLRDGLQNERALVGTTQKLTLIEALIEAGLRRIEVTSFVSKKWIPQLADAEQVARGLAGLERPGVVFSALCPNREGLARAKDGRIAEVAVFMSASESHNRKNTNRTIAESLAVYRELVGEAKRAGLRVRAYVSTVWGCPFEGDVSPSFAAEIGEKLYGFGCYQISFGDTIGVGTPRQTEALTRRFLDHLPVEAIALHMHDTRGTALANVLAGLRLGVSHVDTSVAGMGGCPYAPGAAGNLSTEDLVYMLHGMGIDTGIDLDKLLAAGALAEQMVGRALPSKMLKAGPFQAKPLARSAARATSSSPPTALPPSGDAS